MSALDLIRTLENQGFILTPLPDEKLSVKPAQRLTDELRQAIRAQKAELVRLLTRPYLTPNGELRIPFTADRKYHWWAGGQSLAETLEELNAPPDVWRRYIQGFTEMKQ